MAVTRYVSVGSMLASVVLLTSALLFQKKPFGDGKFLTAFAGLAAILAIIRHRTNIRRLIAGTEHKIGSRRNPKRPTATE